MDTPFYHLTIEKIPLNPHHRQPSTLPPAGGLVDCVEMFSLTFGGYPGMDGEPAAPSPGWRGV